MFYRLRKLSSRFRGQGWPKVQLARLKSGSPKEPSMKLFITLLAGLALFVTDASAKTFKLGDEKAVATITIPDSWNPEEIDDGVEATSKDTETYVAAEIIKATDIKSAIDEGLAFFKKQGVTINQASLEKKEAKMSGFDAVSLQGTGKDKDGPTHVSLTLVIISGENIVMLTYWGTATGEESNGADLSKIAASIKAIN